MSLKFIRDDGEISVNDIENDYPGKHIKETCDGWVIFDSWDEYDTWCKQV